MRSKTLSKILIPKKHLKKSGIITNILRKNVAKYTWDDINASSVHSSKFHIQLKEAAIESVHKKSKLSIETYRPISFLPKIFKV